MFATIKPYGEWVGPIPSRKYVESLNSTSNSKDVSLAHPLDGATHMLYLCHNYDLYLDP